MNADCISPQLYIAPDKREYPDNIFLFLHENTRCRCSLEAPQRGASNEYPQHMFLWRNKNIICAIRLQKCVLSEAMELSLMTAHFSQRE